MGQVCKLEALLSELAPVRGKKKIVFTNGCFDLLHVGHIRYLQEARRQGDLLVVGVNSDASVKLLKGPTRPIQNESDRSEILAALGCVDFAVVFTDETPARLIEEVRPDVLAKGGDWTIETIVGGPYVQSYGGVVKSLVLVDGKSTTKIIEKSKGRLD